MDPLGYNDGRTLDLLGLPADRCARPRSLPPPQGERFPLRVDAAGRVSRPDAVARIAFVVRTAPEPFADFSPILVFRNPEQADDAARRCGRPRGRLRPSPPVRVVPQRRRRSASGWPPACCSTSASTPRQPQRPLGRRELCEHVRDRTMQLLAAAEYLKRGRPGAPGALAGRLASVRRADALNLEWILPQWANEPVLERRDPHIEGATAMLEDALESSDMRRFHFVADQAAVRYVVLRESADPGVRQALERDANLEWIHRAPGFEIWRNRAALPRIRPFSELTAIASPQRLRPAEYLSPSMFKLGPNVFDRGSRWWIHPAFNFRRDGSTVRILGTHARYWPVLGRRFPAAGGTSYMFSARVRTRNAAGAHLKVIWYRRGDDPEVRALDHDYAEPILSGDHGWTEISASPRAPRGDLR